MSKFGDNNGSNRSPQPQSEASLNGFRLDSTQSSWLMDRLEALSEEEKISVAAEADKLAEYNRPPQMQARDMRPQVNPEVLSQMKARRNPMAGQADAHMGEGAGEGLRGVEGGRALPGDYDQEAAYHMAGGDDSDDREGADINAQLLQEKIESLEQQLQEISNLTSRHEVAEHPQDPYDPGRQGYPPQAEGQGAIDPRNQPPYGADYGHMPRPQDQEHYTGQPHTAGYPSDGYQEPHYPQERPTEYYEEPYPEAHDWAGEPAAEDEEERPARYRGVEYDPEEEEKANALKIIAKYQAYVDKKSGKADAGVSNRDDDAMVGGVPADGGYHPPYDPASGVDTAELPQFLAQVQQQKSSKPGYVSIAGVVIALAVVGGVAYNYMGEGVSDVVKSEFGGLSSKQEQKLSTSERVETPSVDEAEVAIATPPDTPVVAVSPADLAQDFGVSQLIGTAGEEVPLIVRMPRGNYPSAFMVVRDLPEWARLSRGRLVNGAWILSLADLNDLKVQIPEDQPGNFSFIMEFVHSADEDPVQRTVNAVINPVVVQPVKPVEETEVAVNELEESSELIKTPEGASGPNSLIIDQALEEKWLERGTRLLRAGDVAAARLAFSHLADQGSGRGAMAMGMTFDPNQPSSRVVAGIKPDVKRAMFWYKRALSLGNESARSPLRMLEKQ